MAEWLHAISSIARTPLDEDLSFQLNEQISLATKVKYVLVGYGKLEDGAC